MAKDPICGMTVDEKTAFSLTRDAKTYFFCSKNCLEKFAKQFNISDKEIQSCTTLSSAPMAFELFKQTGAFGNSFVFLMVGVVTDYTEIGLLWHNVGRKTAIWLPIVTVPQVVLLGWIANKIF